MSRLNDYLENPEDHRFNEDVLYSCFFEHTELFSPAANTKLKTGVYCPYPFGTSRYVDFWNEEKRRCIEGYQNPETGVKITGYYYHFLNYKQLKIVEDTSKASSRRVFGFPRFWAVHYHYTWAVEQARREGKHLCVLKPRGTGYSELMSDIGVTNYTFNKQDPTFYFAFDQGFLTKDGVITKCWDGLEFHNKETERGFKHIRQVKDQDLHKRASYRTKSKEEHRTGGEIIGRVIDNPNKVRGARGFVFFEEGGSFKNLSDAWNICRPLVSQGGVTFALMVVWGTGGEQGPGIEGLEDIFYNPEVFDCLEFDNCWDVGREGTNCGFFFPVYACMDKFMDKHGNPDFKAGKEFHLKKRKTIHAKNPVQEDKYIAEYCFTPEEALMRLSSNIFPVGELQRQLTRIQTNESIQGFIKHGDITFVDGHPKLTIDPNVKPIKKYPHKQNESLDGAVTWLEGPQTDQAGQIPYGLYTIVVDSFYKDDAEDKTSLGAAYVYKHMNNLNNDSEDDILVAWYVARPRLLKTFVSKVFALADIYQATIQGEIAGGGQSLVDYARENHKLHMLEKEPEMVHNRALASKGAGRSYLMNMPVERKKLALVYLADWLLRERSIRVSDNPEEKAEYVLNLHKIYDEALLQELIKFRDDANFDRISALLPLMFMIKERSAIEIEDRIEENDFFNRVLYPDGNFKRSNWMSPKDLRF